MSGHYLIRYHGNWFHLDTSLHRDNPRIVKQCDLVWNLQWNNWTTPEMNKIMSKDQFQLTLWTLGGADNLPEIPIYE
jgi:hypothetical protein